ncbi:Transacylase cctO-like protein [Cladobotryum mycophilum]|uniref:Transacylase cctO-like protein n=1 Tax=Cladobotryum mycophilum TaxID=491253 RepID=A0ABR0SW62_9HYPO
MAPYAPVPVDEESEVFLSGQGSKFSSRRPSRDRVVVILSIWTLILLIVSGVYTHQIYEDFTSLKIYSPADKAIKYEHQIFNEGLWGRRTEYMGFTREVDEQWEKLLQVGIIRVSEQEMKKIGRPTVEDPLKPGYYVYAIEVWHELHCLSILRTAISYTQLEKEVHVLPNVTSRHVEHCIDSLRQIIMCRGSTELGSWRMDKDGEYQPYFKDPHLCRNYAAIEEWANVHRAGNWTPEGHATEAELRAWGWVDGVYVGHKQGLV